MGKLIVFSGAGISAESGIPTFRSEDGTWANHNISEVCDFYTWKNNFDKVHAFYNDRRTALEGVEPNVAHHRVAEWQKRYDTLILTQNIDDMFERAGCTDVVHLHGRATYMTCVACGCEWDIGYAAWDCQQDRCPKCNSLKGVKPGVVFFNEAAPQYAVLNRTLRNLEIGDVFVVIGTSSIVVNITQMLHGLPGYKIINNLEAGLAEDVVYHDAFYNPVTEAIEEIDRILRMRLE